MNKRPMQPLDSKELREEISKTIHKAQNYKYQRQIPRGIAFDADILDWLHKKRGELDLSKFINSLLRPIMEYEEKKK